MYKAELVEEANKLLAISEISEIRKAFAVWKQNVMTSETLEKSCIDACRISLHVKENPNEPIELIKQLYKDAIIETRNIIGNLDDCIDNHVLSDILDHFDLFLHDMFQVTPHGKASIDAQWLRSITIQNEYDIQHILASYLKPLYPMSRTEISEDTGYENVRVDIKLDSNTVIETKCTRKSMSQKKLIEEIEADMVHYSSHNIYFFIYDKCNVIENPLAFKQTYENKINEKNIHITIIQPKELI